MPGAVLLDDLRCDGRVHGGCEMECMIVWKDAWLERIDDAGPSLVSIRAARRRRS